MACVAMSFLFIFCICCLHTPTQPSQQSELIGKQGHLLASNPGSPFRILFHSFGGKPIFLQSCETKSGMESLGSRLLQSCKTKSGTESLGSRLAIHGNSLDDHFSLLSCTSLVFQGNHFWEQNVIMTNVNVNCEGVDWGNNWFDNKFTHNHILYTVNYTNLRHGENPKFLTAIAHK